MTTATMPRTCSCCGAAEGRGATFTGTVPRGKRQPRYSCYCDACRGRAGGTHGHDDNGPDDFPVSAADARRFLTLAAEYAALGARADDPVLAHRLFRAVRDYQSMAARGVARRTKHG